MEQFNFSFSPHAIYVIFELSTNLHMPEISNLQQKRQLYNTNLGTVSRCMCPLFYVQCGAGGEERRGIMWDKGQRKSNKSKHTLQPRLLMLTAGPSGPSHTQTHRPKHTVVSLWLSLSSHLDWKTNNAAWERRRQSEGSNVLESGGWSEGNKHTEGDFKVTDGNLAGRNTERMWGRQGETSWY